jgi:hypothetical protein
MKRFVLSIAMVAGLLVGATSSASADTKTYPCGGTATYTVIMPAGAALDGTKCSGALVLDGSVKIIGDGAFTNSQLTSVIIPNSVTMIRSDAFANTQLTSVTIPDSVNLIGDNAFLGTPLASVAIGKSVITIGNSAFTGTQLKSLTIPSSVSTIGRDAFANTQLTSVTLPNSLKTMGESAFANTQLTTVIIPDSLTYINSAFRNTQLTSVTIPSSITKIGRRAFENTQLTSVVIPNSVTNIESYAFANTRLTSVTIPDSVKIIYGYAFSGNLYLKTISIPDGLLELGDNVFEKNYSVTSILYCGKFAILLPIPPTCPSERKQVIDAAELKAGQEAEAKAAAEIVVRDRIGKAIADLNVKFKSLQKRYTATQLVKIRAGLDWANEIDGRLKDLQGFQYRGLEESVNGLAAEWDNFVINNPLKTTITCVKGKLTKKVTSVKPVCPKGYKKK